MPNANQLDAIHSAIQIENGQILIATRDQSLILFSNKIKNGNFEKIFEIKKSWPMQAYSPFEIKQNLIGVSWDYDDLEAEESYEEEEQWEENHKDDGIYIYSIDNDKIIEKKILRGTYFGGEYSYVVAEDKLILTKKDGIVLYNLNNYELMLEFKENDDIYPRIYPFNEKYFILFYIKDTKAKIKLYNIN